MLTAFDFKHTLTNSQIIKGPLPLIFELDRTRKPSDRCIIAQDDDGISRAGTASLCESCASSTCKQLLLNERAHANFIICPAYRVELWSN